jgi:hypothetical protein
VVYALKGLVQLSEQKSGWKGGFPVATSCGAPHTPHPLQDSVARSWVPATKLLQVGGQRVLSAMGAIENRGIELTPFSFKQCEGLYDAALIAV